jgi:hypothetical protein
MRNKLGAAIIERPDKQTQTWYGGAATSIRTNRFGRVGLDHSRYSTFFGAVAIMSQSTMDQQSKKSLFINMLKCSARCFAAMKSFRQT